MVLTRFSMIVRRSPPAATLYGRTGCIAVNRPARLPQRLPRRRRHQPRAGGRRGDRPDQADLSRVADERGLMARRQLAASGTVSYGLSSGQLPLKRLPDAIRRTDSPHHAAQSINEFMSYEAR
jgi:hypothetical protein